VVVVSAFFTGDVVVASATTQGMTKGERYVVVDYEERSTPFGKVVTYMLQRGDDRFPVGNLHLLASKVEATAKDRVRIRVLKPRWDADAEEWVVVTKINGEECEARTYFTTDCEDAMNTYKALVEAAKKEQL
jgi:hypothetical protein